ncbi:putative glucose dehydrogenase [Emericellopsis atlantica]|uniref:Glucose dehydrogenase n=1 Tax=Emericellopsis atlantica TaxID=2614577 RepID=A0A9P8CQR3_9HYPO|nr:putative glucose dehydrogenase [Emericellopsis atlantica]KAG9256214.1 putative glucose dehydrogenase [Emericellopsis atlantica]
MGIQKTLPPGLDEVDVIIAGGGTAGCVIAARLASALPNLQILLLEQGPNNFEDPFIVNLGLFFAHLMPDGDKGLFNKANPSRHVNGRELTVLSGGCLGGGSSINMGMYSRPQWSDFDGWGVEGWTTEDMLRCMKKVEDYHDPDPEGTHGTRGPVQVSGGLYRAKRAEEDFLRALDEVGWPIVEDLQDLRAVNSFARARRMVSPEGRRQDAAHKYLHPRLSDRAHSNLHVLVETQAVKVLVEDGQAKGVVFRSNPKFGAADVSEKAVKSRKMVVVSGGCFGSPTILQRSGVGPRDVLSKAGVPLLVENNGVGAGYEDHQAMAYGYKTSLEMEETLNGLLFGLTDIGELLKNNDPRLGYNGQDVNGKIRPTDEEAETMGPAFKAVWDAHFRDTPDKPLAGLSLINGIPGLAKDIPPASYLGLSAFSMYPLSRGHVNITGPDMCDPVDFDTGFLADKDGIDIKKHIWTYKKQREIMRRMPCYRGEVPSWHPPFPETSDAVCRDVTDALPDPIEDIVYTREDEEVIGLHVQAKAETTWHSMGTCKMKAQEEGGAVDGKLGVYGVKGLKVADLSICPRNVSGNTCMTALAIGENAADIFIRELQ